MSALKTAVTSDTGSGIAERRLAKALASRCRGTTLILGEPPAALVEKCEEAGLATRVAPAGLAIAVARAPLDEDPERFDTVILFEPSAGTLDAQVEDPVRRESEPPGFEPDGGQGGAGDLPRDGDPGGDAARLAIDGAWKLCAPDGRLVVCVRNGECLSDPGAFGPSTRRALGRLLRGKGEARLLKDQPFGWVAMMLDVTPRIEGTLRQRLTTIARLCRGDVLELGCGAGHLSRAIAARGLNVRGVDMSRDKIRRARELYPLIRFDVGDILDLGIEETFDTVLLAEVLEHVPADAGLSMLDAAWARVAPGGRLVVSVPNEDCVPHRNHVREFTREDLDGELRAYGDPVLVADQPYKWLLMFVERPR